MYKDAGVSEHFCWHFTEVGVQAIQSVLLTLVILIVKLKILVIVSMHNCVIRYTE